jgi:hypothetical protein
MVESTSLLERVLDLAHGSGFAAGTSEECPRVKRARLDLEKAGGITA